MIWIFLSLFFFSLHSYEPLPKFTSMPLTPLQASFKVEYSARFPHFVDTLFFDHKNGTSNKISYDRTHDIYSLFLDNRTFVTRALTINYKDKEVLWAGRYTQKYKKALWQDAYPNINLMIGYLRTFGLLEMRPALLSAEIQGFKLTPNNQHLISFFVYCDTMFLRSLELQNNERIDKELDIPAKSFDISLSSKFVFCADARGHLTRYFVKNLLQESWELTYLLKKVCCGYDDASLVGISEAGVHYIRFVKSRSASKWADHPRTCATYKGNYKNIWRSTTINSFIVQDYEGCYHELSLTKPDIANKMDG